MEDDPIIIRCTLPAGNADWRPPLFPGSEDAEEAGCTCPANQPWPGAFDFSSDCPVHELVKPTH
jgi:hypothetical protein